MSWENDEMEGESLEDEFAKQRMRVEAMEAVIFEKFLASKSFKTANYCLKQ